jgi:hypothetical protein
MPWVFILGSSTSSTTRSARSGGIDRSWGRCGRRPRAYCSWQCYHGVLGPLCLWVLSITPSEFSGVGVAPSCSGPSLVAWIRGDATEVDVLAPGPRLCVARKATQKCSHMAPSCHASCDRHPLMSSCFLSLDQASCVLPLSSHCPATAVSHCSHRAMAAGVGRRRRRWLGRAYAYIGSQVEAVTHMVVFCIYYSRA